MKPLCRSAVLTAGVSGQGLDVETNSPTPVEGVELSPDIPLHRTHNLCRAGDTQERHDSGRCRFQQLRYRRTGATEYRRSYRSLKAFICDLRNGLEVELVSGDFQPIRGIAEYSEYEQIWVARFDWQDLREKN